MRKEGSLEGEYRKHAKGKAFQRWRKQMANKRKLIRVAANRMSEIRNRLINACHDDDIARIVAKDSHLVSAAIEHGAIILSRDDQCRNHLRSICQDIEGLDRILWVNPSREEEDVVPWMNRGAPDENQRRLGG